MNLNNLVAILAIIFLITITLTALTRTPVFMWVTIIISLFGLGLQCTAPITLNSELIIEEYLRSTYPLDIKKENISEILKTYDTNAELLNIIVYNIPDSDSIYVKLVIKAGNIKKYAYTKFEYNYTIGINDNKVFIKKGN